MTCGPPAPSQLAPSSCPSQLAPSSCPSELAPSSCPSQLAPSSCPSQLAPSSCPSRLHVLALNRNSVYAAVTFHLKDCNTVVTIMLGDGGDVSLKGL